MYNSRAYQSLFIYSSDMNVDVEAEKRKDALNFSRPFTGEAKSAHLLSYVTAVKSTRFPFNFELFFSSIVLAIFVYHTAEMMTAA